MTEKSIFEILGTMKEMSDNILKEMDNIFDAENELIEVRHSGELTPSTIGSTFGFEAEYKNFTVKGKVDLDIEPVEAEEEVGIPCGYQFNNIECWYDYEMKAINEASEEIKLTAEEIKDVKYYVENHFDNLTQQL